MRTLAILCVVGLAAASLEGEFQSWAQMHRKAYSVEEYPRRFAAWQANLLYVTQENQKGNAWTLGMNSLADLTHDEYKAIYLSSFNYTAEPIQSPPSAVTNVDWRTSGCVYGVKDQGQCGSCYSFSATAAVEFCHCRSGKPLVALSDQHCVDCSLNYGNLGCSGGWMENCWKYYIAYGGQDTQASYPYTAVRGTCKASLTTIGAKMTGWSMCTATEAGLQSCIVGRVTSVAINAGLSSFQLYKSGIYCPTGCLATSLNHAVTAVGQQTSTAGDYYIVKNSWGTGWGNAGYIWMCANANNNCGICSHADYPTGCS